MRSKLARNAAAKSHHRRIVVTPSPSPDDEHLENLDDNDDNHSDSDVNKSTSNGVQSLNNNEDLDVIEESGSEDNKEIQGPVTAPEDDLLESNRTSFNDGEGDSGGGTNFQSCQSMRPSDDDDGGNGTTKISNGAEFFMESNPHSEDHAEDDSDGDNEMEIFNANSEDFENFTYDKPLGGSETCLYTEVNMPNHKCAKRRKTTVVIYALRFLANGKSPLMKTSHKVKIVLKKGDLLVETHKNGSSVVPSIKLPLESSFTIVHPNQSFQISNLCDLVSADSSESFCYCYFYAEEY